MNPARDERFLELAMKLGARECSAAEKAELKQILAEEPQRATQLTKLCASAVIARELVPLVSALEATEGEMTFGEMEAFRRHVARVRRSSKEEATPPPPQEDSPHGNDGNGGEGDGIIEAEVVPEPGVNGYKVAFYLLVLVILIGGSIVLLKSCSPLKTGRQVKPNLPTFPVPMSAPESARTLAEPRLRPAPGPSVPDPVPERIVEPVDVAPPADKSALPNYQGAEWVKVFAGGSKPGFNQMFRQFVAPAGTEPMAEGLIGSNGKVPTTLMVLRKQGKAWDTRSFPGLPSEPDLVVGLGSNRLALSYRTLPSQVYLLDGARARRLATLGPLICTAVHAVSADRFFLHCYDGSAFEVNGSKVTRLGDTDAATYVHDGGNPTDMRRGSIHSIAQADTGETMGIFWRRPASLGSAALVRFNGTVWEYVGSLDRDYLESKTHFLTKDSLVGVMDQRVVIVKGGQQETMGVPPEFEADQSAKLMAVRAASTDDFVLVDNHGSVYCYLNGKYEQAVAPMASLRGAGTIGFRSVTIAPDGVIYAIHGLNQWSSSTIYKLAPR